METNIFKHKVQQSLTNHVSYILENSANNGMETVATGRFPRAKPKIMTTAMITTTMDMSTLFLCY